MLGFPFSDPDSIDRRARNRVSARESRNRRKAHMEALERRVAELEAEATLLRARVAQLQAASSSRDASGPREAGCTWTSPEVSSAGTAAMLRSEYDEFVGRVRADLADAGSRSGPTAPTPGLAADDSHQRDRATNDTALLPVLDAYHERLSSSSPRRRRLVHDALQQLTRCLTPTAAEKFVLWMAQNPGLLIESVGAPGEAEAGGARKRPRSCEVEQAEIGQTGPSGGERGPDVNSAIGRLLSGAFESTPALYSNLASRLNDARLLLGCWSRVMENMRQLSESIETLQGCMALTTARFRAAFTPRQECKFHVWLSENSLMIHVRGGLGVQCAANPHGRDLAQMLDTLWVPRTAAGAHGFAPEHLRWMCDNGTMPTPAPSQSDPRAVQPGSGLLFPNIAPAHRAVSATASPLTPQVSVQFRGSRPFFHVQPPVSLHRDAATSVATHVHARPRVCDVQQPLHTGHPLACDAPQNNRARTAAAPQGQRADQVHVAAIHPDIHRPGHPLGPPTVQLARPLPLPQLRPCDSLRRHQPLPPLHASPSFASSASWVGDPRQVRQASCGEASAAGTGPAPDNGFEQALQAVVDAAYTSSSDLTSADGPDWSVDNTDNARGELSLEHDHILEKVFGFPLENSGQPGHA